MNEDFAERLAYWQFRGVIRSTVALGPIRLRRLKDLLKIAAYDELRSLGMNKSGVAVALGVSQGLISSISSRVAKPASWPEAAPMARTIPQLLFDNGGSLDEFEVEEKLYLGGLARRGQTLDRAERDPGFYYRMELTLGELRRWGVIRRTQKGAEVRFELTPKGKEQIIATLSQPFADENDLLDDVLSLGRILLAAGPSSEGEIMKIATASGLTEIRVLAALRWSIERQDAGDESPILVHERPEGRLFSANPEAVISSPDRVDEQQMAILELTKRMKAFIAWMASDPPAYQVSQKVVSFRIRDEDLPGFLRSHVRWVYAELNRLEAAAQTDSPAMTYVFSWFGEVLAKK